MAKIKGVAKTFKHGRDRGSGNSGSGGRSSRKSSRSNSKSGG